MEAAGAEPLVAGVRSGALETCALHMSFVQDEQTQVQLAELGSKSAVA